VHYLLKALPYYYISSRSIFMGNYIYILNSKVVKGPLVKQGYIFN
jgi:hypothetical protein